MEKRFELRKFYNYPYSKLGINGGTALPDAEEDKFKASVMQYGVFGLDVDIFQNFKKTSGTIRVVSIPSTFPLNTKRFTLPQEDEKLAQTFSEGDSILVQHEELWFTYEGVVLFVDEQVIEVGVNAEAGGGIGDGTYGGDVLFRNQTPIKYIEIKYNIAPASFNTYSNQLDGGEQVLSVNLPSTNTSYVLQPQTGGVLNWDFDEVNALGIREPNKNDYQVPQEYEDKPSITPIQLRGIPYIIPYWSEALADNYNNNTAPDDYIGTETPRLIIQVKAWLPIRR